MFNPIEYIPDAIEAVRDTYEFVFEDLPNFVTNDVPDWFYKRWVDVKGVAEDLSGKISPPETPKSLPEYKSMYTYFKAPPEGLGEDAENACHFKAMMAFLSLNSKLIIELGPQYAEELERVAVKGREWQKNYKRLKALQKEINDLKPKIDKELEQKLNNPLLKTRTQYKVERLQLQADVLEQNVSRQIDWPVLEKQIFEEPKGSGRYTVKLVRNEGRFVTVDVINLHRSLKSQIKDMEKTLESYAEEMEKLVYFQELFDKNIAEPDTRKLVDSYYEYLSAILSKYGITETKIEQ